MLALLYFSLYIFFFHHIILLKLIYNNCINLSKSVICRRFFFMYIMDAWYGNIVTCTASSLHLICCCQFDSLNL